MTSHAAGPTASVDTMFGLAGEAFKGAETLASLNLQTLKTLMAESQETSRLASSTRDPAELVKLQVATLQAAPLKALAYGRQVQEVFATLGAARQVAYEDGIAGAQAKFLEAMNGFFKNAPGSEKILSMAQSAVDASNSAYRNMNATSKRLSDTLAANVTKAEEAVTQGASSALAKIEV
ncbi:TIGR01841 family phasin [Variovorax sp. GT1P44]|uniref:TIGR01841 family phasin n=1 Tax=Variovorax sp. GT1P44 TaxID=3443742 RepID=UPI003F48E0EE